MEDSLRNPKKKRSKKDVDENGQPLPGIEALAKLTSSDVISQVKAGLSRIAPLELELEPEGDDPFPFEEPPSENSSDPY